MMTQIGFDKEIKMPQYLAEVYTFVTHYEGIALLCSALLCLFVPNPNPALTECLTSHRFSSNEAFKSK